MKAREGRRSETDPRFVTFTNEDLGIIDQDAQTTLRVAPKPAPKVPARVKVRRLDLDACSTVRTRQEEM